MSKLDNFFTLKDRVALVTGAARGNGYAIAKGFLDAGAIVYFLDILPINIENKKAFKIQTDLTKDGELIKVVDKIIKQQSRIDILVNNAGVGQSMLSENYSIEKWNKTLKINLEVPFKLIQLVGKQMIKQKKGSIINITSLGAELGFPDNPAYLASKGGLRSMTKGFARDWGKYGIRVNNIAPGYISTPLHEGRDKNSKIYKERLSKMIIKRWGKPEDLVGVAIFLSSDAASYITGEDINVDGGWKANGL